jgi:hypothetical protein
VCGGRRAIRALGSATRSAGSHAGRGRRRYRRTRAAPGQCRLQRGTAMNRSMRLVRLVVYAVAGLSVVSLHPAPALAAGSASAARSLRRRTAIGVDGWTLRQVVNSARSRSGWMRRLTPPMRPPRRRPPTPAPLPARPTRPPMLPRLHPAGVDQSAANCRQRRATVLSHSPVLGWPTNILVRVMSRLMPTP